MHFGCQETGGADAMTWVLVVFREIGISGLWLGSQKWVAVEFPVTSSPGNGGGFRYFGNPPEVTGGVPRLPQSPSASVAGEYSVFKATELD